MPVVKTKSEKEEKSRLVRNKVEILLNNEQSTEVIILVYLHIECFFVVLFIKLYSYVFYCY